MNLKVHAKKLINNLPIVVNALNDFETPIVAKIFALITATYALSPIDLIPDFIPIIGYIDDIIILPLLISLTIHYIPKHIIVRIRNESKQTIPHKHWKYSFPIIFIWILILYWIVHTFNLI